MQGSQILSTLRNSPSQFSSIEIIARRNAPNTPASSVPVKEFVDKDTSKWAAYVSSLTPPPSILFSALATTRANAGGFENQYKIEHDLVLELAKAAKKAGTKTYVLVSSASASPNAMFAYTKMKGEIEEHIKEVGFDHTIIVQPGLISGQREESRPAEAVMRKVATGLGKISTHWLKDGWAQDADIIGRATVHAALKVERGEVKDKVWVLGGKEIIQLGRTEWKDLN
jgi:NAD(P)H-binding